jgi:RES domain-containing protein
MIVYRICNEKFKDDLSGNGAKLFGGRWNSKGFAMLYTSEHISLSALEMLVHNQFQDFAVPLSLLKIQLPIPTKIKEIKNYKLKENWHNDAGYTKFIGNEFVKSESDLFLKVPSAVVTEENNVLINPLHKDFKKVKIVEQKIFRTDKRFFTL